MRVVGREREISARSKELANHQRCGAQARRGAAVPALESGAARRRGSLRVLTPLRTRRRGTRSARSPSRRRARHP
jgi:hypothetical protein